MDAETVLECSLATLLPIALLNIGLVTYEGASIEFDVDELETSSLFATLILGVKTKLLPPTTTKSNRFISLECLNIFLN